jgi:cytoskeleton protein RodZ
MVQGRRRSCASGRIARVRRILREWGWAAVLLSRRSSVTEPTATVTAPRVGADLAAARERLGYGVAQMSAYLRIRQSYLAALEQGRIDALPGNAYALVFLRSYATALGLDPDELSRRFKAEAAEVGRKTELAFPAPLPERGLPAGAVVLLGLVLVVGAYAGWYRLSGEGRLPTEAVAPVPARLAPLAEAPAPVPTATPPAQVAAATPPAQVATAPPPAAIVSPAPDRAEPGAPAATDPNLSPSSAAAATPVPPAASAGGAADGSAGPQAGLAVRASADSWIQVRDHSGQVLFSRILHAGESWPVPGGPGLVLTTGNAGGTELVLDGAVTPPLGTPGAVRRDLPLDPDAVKSGRLVPLAAASR